MPSSNKRWYGRLTDLGNVRGIDGPLYRRSWIASQTIDSRSKNGKRDCDMQHSQIPQCVSIKSIRERITRCQKFGFVL